MQFLNGLNDACSQVKTQILRMGPIPSIDKSFSLVIQEERQRALGFNVNPSVEFTTLAVKNQGFTKTSNFSGNAENVKGNGRKGRPICSHCDDHALSNLTNKSSSTPITSGTKYPLSHYLDSSKLYSSYSLYCSLIATIPEPKFYHEVVKDPKW